MLFSTGTFWYPGVIEYMFLSSSHIARLFYHLQAGELTAQEQKEWEEFAQSHPEEVGYLLQIIEDPHFSREFHERQPQVNEVLGERLLATILSQLPLAKQPVTIPPVHRVHFLKTAWFRYVAVLVLLITGIAVYYKTTRTTADKMIVQTTEQTKDILPGSDKAILTLSDGKKIELNKAAAETIQDGQLSIRNNQGQLSYENSNVSAVNTMTTPKGGQYQLTLADGTKVWLNAASSITYPTAFTGKSREVRITGEVYFEVSTNKEKPFVVHTPADNITVLGTSFNVNAYSDERYMKATLVEGKIKIGEQLLQPGQAYSSGKIHFTNVAQDVAWKNGLFYFDHAPIQTVMRQIARWYDVDVKYEGKVRDAEINGKMGRNLTLQEILSILKKLHIPVRLENKTIIVSS